MNFTQLRCFISAIDNSSFTIAAERLNFSQSAVSKNIKDLENTIGVPLINRAHHRISLTNAGRYFYKVARNVVDDMDYTIAYLQSKKGKTDNLVKIGFCNTPLEQKIMPLFLDNLKKADSRLDVQLVFALNNSISELLNHHIDLCFIARDSVDSVADIEFEPIIPGRFVIACPQGSPLAQKTMISMNDLKGQDLFMIDPNGSLSFQAKFQNFLIPELGIEKIKFVQDFFAMGIYVKAGWGVGLLPNFIADYQTPGIIHVPFDYGEIPPYGIAHMALTDSQIEIAPIISAYKKAVTSFTGNKDC
ncbi:LysR family transcriptional regulator [Lactobacillus sp. ESL0791]|uniref:LysR family transcriptional regulator n=1 Tax=Lactobacillus sp. ESL0791 TaxID=2983234 RepID=UPI0023FA0509|nr:LysR family transcriptional regulator [Lactobacillus sp. ESL0791]MDF7639664.1 LysR family transcriptional regulator [Lactobacillus sp. ESL0791]